MGTYYTILIDSLLVQLKTPIFQILNHIEEVELKYEILAKLVDSGVFSLSDVKGLVAALTFILQSATRNDVEPASLDSELQQLGFPKVRGAGIVYTRMRCNVTS